MKPLGGRASPLPAFSPAVEVLVVEETDRVAGDSLSKMSKTRWHLPVSRLSRACFLGECVAQNFTAHHIHSKYMREGGILANLHKRNLIWIH